MNKNEIKTTEAPTQYTQLEYWAYCIISPIKDRGIVSDKPTVTTNGVVNNMAYAHDMSLKKEEIELSC